MMKYRYSKISLVYKTDDMKISRNKDNETGLEVCIKKISVGRLEDRSKLLEEIISLYVLRDYPNFCKILNYRIKGEGNKLDSIYIVMEYYKGGNLCNEILRRSSAGLKYTEEELLDFIAQLLEGFSLMQKLNIFHRDIKPDNIFIGDDGKLKIGDFGSITTSISNNYTIVGSHSYMSPEMRKRHFMSEGSPGAELEDFNIMKSDVWSLGVTFLFMIITEIPKDLKNSSNIPQTLTEKCNSIDNKVFRRLLKKMLKIDPEVRSDFITINDWFNKKIGKLNITIRSLPQKTEGQVSKVDSSVQTFKAAGFSIQTNAVISVNPAPRLVSTVLPDPIPLSRGFLEQTLFKSPPFCERCELSSDFAVCKRCKYLCHIPCLGDNFFECPKCHNVLNYSKFKIRCRNCQILFKGKHVNPNCKHRLCIQCQILEIGCRFCFGFEICEKKRPLFGEFNFNSFTCTECSEPLSANGKVVSCARDGHSFCAVCKRTAHEQSCVANDSRKFVQCLGCGKGMIKEIGSIFVFCKKCNRIYCYVCLKSVNETSHLNCMKLYCH